MLYFTLASIALMVTPGPGVLSLAGVGSSFGAKPGLHYLLGLCIGNFLVGVAVVTGLAAIVFSIPQIRIILLALAGLYLSFLALKIAFAGSKIGFIISDKAPGFAQGCVLQIINPKCYAVNTALFTGFVFLPDNFLLETVLKFVIKNMIWIPVHLLWLYLGVSLKRLALTERTQRIINILMGVSLITVVILASIV